MATLTAAIKAALTGTAAWTSLVTGGTLLTDDLGKNGLQPDDLSYDNDGVMKLTAMITWSSGGAAEVVHSTQRRFFYIRLFADPTNGWANLRAAQRLLRLPVYESGVLHRRQVQTDTEGHALIHWVSPGPEFYDEPLGGAAASFERFYAEYRQR